MYELLGLCLALALLLAFNTVISLATSLLWRGLAPALAESPATARARMLFWLRVLPVIAALVVVLLILVPAYAVHEPRHSGEEVSFKLAALALLSAAGLVLAGWRGLTAWRATRQLVRNWLQHAEPLPQVHNRLPLYRIQHPFPVLALVGAWQPRLFVAEQVLAALSPAELEAALAHEVGHLTARDNFKRVLLRACRDVLTLVPCGRALDRAWEAASEEAADEHAAQQNQATALALAAALVKIARLAKPETKPALLISASFIGYEAAPVARRVQRLLHLTNAPAPTTHLARSVATLQWTALGTLLGLTLLALSLPEWLATAHHALEFVVRSLQ